MEQPNTDPTYADMNETSESPPRNRPQREMFVPNMTNSNDFG